MTNINITPDSLEHPLADYTAFVIQDSDGEMRCYLITNEGDFIVNMSDVNTLPVCRGFDTIEDFVNFMFDDAKIAKVYRTMEDFTITFTDRKV